MKELYLAGGEGGTGVEAVTARASHEGIHVLGVDVLLHGVSPGFVGAPGPDSQIFPHLVASILPPWSIQTVANR